MQLNMTSEFSVGRSLEFEHLSPPIFSQLHLVKRSHSIRAAGRKIEEGGLPAVWSPQETATRASRFQVKLLTIGGRWGNHNWYLTVTSPPVLVVLCYAWKSLLLNDGRNFISLANKHLLLAREQLAQAKNRHACITIIDVVQWFWSSNLGCW